MSKHADESRADWFGQDHVLVIQAAANLNGSPEYARQLWATADHPERAALQLLELLIRERGGYDPGRSPE
jgi:hypothetical protein